MKQQFSKAKIALVFCAFISTNVFPQNNASALLASANNSINPIIVTATRTPTKANEVLADNIYIGPEEIEQAGQSSLVELLQRQKGVTISSYGTGVATGAYIQKTTAIPTSFVFPIKTLYRSGTVTAEYYP